MKDQTLPPRPTDVAQYITCVKRHFIHFFVFLKSRKDGAQKNNIIRYNIDHLNLLNNLYTKLFYAQS